MFFGFQTLLFKFDNQLHSLVCFKNIAFGPWSRYRKISPAGHVANQIAGKAIGFRPLTNEKK